VRTRIWVLPQFLLPSSGIALILRYLVGGQFRHLTQITLMVSTALVVTG